MTTKPDALESTTSLSPVVRNAKRTEQGSALIVSLLIMIILTLLGVTFLVMGESEEKISVANRDHSQTLYMAEAAVGVGRTWFNDPSSSNPFRPSSTQLKRTIRRGHILEAATYTNAMENDPLTRLNSSAVDGSAGSIYTGGKLTGSTILFDKDYRGTYANSFWGRRNTPDVLLCKDANLDVDGDTTADCTGAMAAYMNNLNSMLSMTQSLRNDGHSSRDHGTTEVEQIQIYRPPMDFDLAQRYGICTIEATAVKRIGGRVIARRTVRDVIQEIPFPAPAGAIETEGSVTFAGSSEVHWGVVVSSDPSGDITLAGGANVADVGFPRSASTRWGMHYSFNPASRTDLEPGGPIAQATALTEMLAITRDGIAAPNNYAAPEAADPWLLFRARNNVENACSGTGAMICPYAPGNNLSGNTDPLDKGSTCNQSNRWARQIVRFPTMDYQTWKDIAKSGQSGMYYYKHVAGTTYRLNGIGAANNWATYVNMGPAGSPTAVKPGMYFFDTVDSEPPTPNGSNLTPDHTMAGIDYMQGFLYLNTTGLSSAGMGGGRAVHVNAPGEPYMDDGIDLAESPGGVGDDCICIRFDDIDGCLLGVRPLAYDRSTEGLPITDPANQLCSVANDTFPDSCKCDDRALDQINSTSARKATAAREAQTYHNQAWDYDLDNDGLVDNDAPRYDRTDTPWTTFVGANNGATQTTGGGGHGYAAKIVPHFTLAESATGSYPNVAAKWKRDPRFLNWLTGGAARQVHEEFLNLEYVLTNGNAVSAWPNGNGSTGAKVNYSRDHDVNKENAGGAAIGWTTKARDSDGTMITLPSLHVNGIIYLEGDYEAQGNLNIYGSMLAREGYSSSGSLEVWFNEGLLKGQFPDPNWGLPRVYNSARDTN